MIVPVTQESYRLSITGAVWDKGGNCGGGAAGISIRQKSGPEAVRLMTKGRTPQRLYNTRSLTWPRRLNSFAEERDNSGEVVVRKYAAGALFCQAKGVSFSNYYLFLFLAGRGTVGKRWGDGGKEEKKKKKETKNWTHGGRVGNVTFHYTLVLDIVDYATFVGTYNEISQLPDSEW
jgi:hypothetical protein